MSGLLVLWVGQRPGKAVEELCAEYRERIARLMPVQEVRLRPEEGRKGDPRRAVAREGDELMRHLAPADYLVALDEHGRERSSEELARLVGDRRRLGRLAFAVGSDLGLAEAVKARAAEVLSLSRLTLPHQLARLVLFEQLYRACDMLAGGSYHRGGP